MKAEHIGGRRIRFLRLHEESQQYSLLLDEVTITLSHSETETNRHNSANVALDNRIMPAIVAAINLYYGHVEDETLEETEGQETTDET